MKLWCFLVGFLAVSAGVVESIATQQVVKMSESGSCHCSGGQFYDRISNFTAFETIEDCLGNGGREPQRGQEDCSLELSNDVIIPKVEATDDAISGMVKKSTSGICHCPGGQFYERMSNFIPFDTIDACLASGGREPQRGQGNCLTADSDKPELMRLPGSYNRNIFGGWSDNDGDCQNTRHELLIARSIESVKLSEDGCEVVHGRWADYYTGNIHTSAQELEIDHVVPLFYAWMRGARLWPSEKQRHFVNDPANLLPVGMAVNRSKGASSPLEWLPPAAEFDCEYLLRFSRVITRYELKLSAEEEAALKQLTAEKCDLI